MRSCSRSSTQAFSFQVAIVAAALVTGGLGCSDNASEPSVGGEGGSPTLGAAAGASGGASAGGAIGEVTSSVA